MVLVRLAFIVGSMMALSVNASGIRKREIFGSEPEARDPADATNRNLIVGGTEVTDPNKYPYIARIINTETDQICGGALVSVDKVLTSAYCLNNLFGLGASLFQKPVRIGGTNLTGGTEYLADCVVIHPMYQLQNGIPVYDFAIITLLSDAPEELVVLGSAQPDLPATASQLIFVGFGATTSGSFTASSTLQEITVDYMAFGQCDSNAYYNFTLTDPDAQFCGGPENGQGPCVGDGGGALIVPNVQTGPSEFSDVVVGIYSYTEGFPSCGTGTIPDVYAKVAYDNANFINAAQATGCTLPPNVPPTRSPTPFPTAAPPTPPPTPVPTPVPTPSPTPPPTTPSPTSAPTSAPTNCICFSGTTTMQVFDDDESLHPVAMKDLKIGQRVYAGFDNDYKPISEIVYGFAHHEIDKYGEFLQITTDCEVKTICETDLKISSNHMIFREGEKNPVAAGSLSVGDVLLRQSIDDRKAHRAVITAIQPIVEKGVFAPLTKDGTVIVNGIHASSYVTASPLAPRLVDTVAQVMSEQTLFHLWMAPYRLVCTKLAPELCLNDYDETDGYIHWLTLGRTLAEYFDSLPKMIVWIGLLALSFVSGFLMLLEDAMERPVFWLVQIACGYFMFCRFRSMRGVVILLDESEKKTA